MLIYCICGCGKQLEKFDSRGRIRKMIKGHNMNGPLNHRRGIKLSYKTKEKIRIANIGKKYGEETKNKHRIAMFGKNNHRWKGGKYKMSLGYICIWKPNHPFSNRDGYIFEHRLIMEQKLKRYLTEKEVVHHINHIKDDNRVENLKLFSSNGDHMKEEYKERRWNG